MVKLVLIVMISFVIGAIRGIAIGDPRLAGEVPGFVIFLLYLSFGVVFSIVVRDIFRMEKRDRKPWEDL